MESMRSISPLLAELSGVTKRAGELALESRKSLVRELKPDGSVVTNGDRAVEEFLRPILTELVPGTSVWGEEFGLDPEGENGWWLVDPVDGTTNYAFGAPYWGVSIALMQQNRLTLGAIYLPDLNEMVVAEAGLGAFLNQKPLEAIPTGSVRDEEMISYSERLIRRYPKAVFPGRMRCSGAFVIDGAFTATQRFRGLIGMGEKLYDVAASVLINSELGADIRYASGAPFILANLKADIKIEEPWLIFPKESGFRI